MPARTRPISVPTYTKPKTVRFAYENKFYSPRIPVSSIPASPAVITPPSTGYGLPGPSPFPFGMSYPPYTQPAKSVQYTGLVHVHPVLGMSAVTYDLREHPSTIMTRNNYSLSTRTLRQPATTPPLPFLKITSIHLPWTIKVYASNGSYVTLEDIFDCMYRSLRANITSGEFKMFPTREDQRRATRAYEKRYKRLRNNRAYDEEKRGGMKRVDFLMGHTKFLGINSSRRPDEWRLRVA
ncbi:hypothetical protein BYT27DRAFT_7183564 [Phlegmacium glaucopus]|nr:hypothetical protein BYT27DRAFT_7183564 [Phlegmacium glaucopus]